MVRIILTYILPLVLPTVMYFAWLSWVKKKIAAAKAQAAAEGAPEPDAEQIVHDFEIKTPWLRLAMAGLGLVVVTLMLSLILLPDNPENSTYEPPRLENGDVVPGQFKPADQ